MTSYASSAPHGLTGAQYRVLQANTVSISDLALPFERLPIQESELLVNRHQFWPRFLEDIDRARQQILIQVFGWTPDEFTEDLVRRLGAKVRQGVPVRLLLDAKGARLFLSKTRAGESLLRLAQSLGLQVQLSRDVRLSGPHFDHRKIYVVDDVAYLTGFTFEEEMFSKKFDLALRVQGALRNQLLWAFWSSWKYFGNNPRVEFHEMNRAWSGGSSAGKGDVWKLVQNVPGGRREITEELLGRLQTARKSIVLINSYFGESRIWELVTQARRNGVSVTIVSPRVPEHEMYGRQFAADALKLLSQGADVRYYDGEEGFGRLHAKVAMIDDDFVQMGSSNFDPLSMRRNFEIALQSRDVNWNRDFRERVLGHVQKYSTSWAGPANRAEWQSIRRGAVCSGLLRTLIEATAPLGRF